MKTTIFAIASLFAVAATSFTAQTQAAPEKINIGAELPGATTPLKNASGTTDISLRKAAGKNGLLVMFSCNTCPYVIKNQPVTKRALDYAAANHVGVVIINSNEAKRGGDDSYSEMRKYAKEQGYNVPYVVDEDSKLADMFGANHTPEVFLFDNKSKLVYRGAMNDNPGNPGEYKVMYIEDAIRAMVGGKEINPATTKSIGCSIKRKS
jgi:thioredoxin-related protein